MRILVTGGRYFQDWQQMCRVLDDLKPTVIIQGGARGADMMARQYANSRKIPRITYDYLSYLGRAGGPARNSFMVKDSRADLCVAFPGGDGTKDCVTKAKAWPMDVFDAERGIII